MFASYEAGYSSVTANGDTYPLTGMWDEVEITTVPVNLSYPSAASFSNSNFCQGTAAGSVHGGDGISIGTWFNTYMGQVSSTTASDSGFAWTNAANDAYWGGASECKGNNTCIQMRPLYRCDDPMEEIQIHATNTLNCAWYDVELRPFHGGCFVPKTQILMEPGKYVSIDQIRKGDRVLDPVTHSEIAVTRVIAGPEKEALYRFDLENSEVTVTNGHPMVTLEGLKPAREVKLTDKLLLSDGKYHSLSKREIIAPEKNQQVWNIEIGNSSDKNQHMIEADGIVTGDLFLQNQLKTKKKAITLP